MLKSDRMLDPVSTGDYLHKEICTTLCYFLEILSRLVDLMFVCQQKKKCF